MSVLDALVRVAVAPFGILLARVLCEVERDLPSQAKLDALIADGLGPR